MADSMSITGGTTNIDISKWKKLTPQEIIKEKSKGQEIPAEIITWAEQMQRFDQMPDDVTYEEVDGDVGIDALDKLGLPTTPEEDKAVNPSDTETPDAVKDPAKDSEVPPEQDNNPFINAQPGQAGDAKPKDDTEPQDNTDLTLADPALTTDPEEIRKRKAKKGLA